MGSSREYPNFPIPGVGAVVLREVEGRPEVLLIRRGSEPMAGGWSLPGGAIELGESVREACVRETLEETGLTVQALAEVEIVDIIHRDAMGRVQYHYVVVDILCRVLGGDLLSGTDASEVAWADVRQVLELGDFALTSRACTVIRKALIMNEGLK
jgi:ADP-ribose pyrophosphatase YjhB (NUDIX family)